MRRRHYFDYLYQKEKPLITSEPMTVPWSPGESDHMLELHLKLRLGLPEQSERQWDIIRNQETEACGTKVIYFAPPSGKRNT